MAAADVLNVLAELEYSLRSKSNPQERITSEEESFLRNVKERLVDSFLVGGLVSSVVCWTGTRRFRYGPRIIYSAGAGYLGATWACKWNLRSCLDPIIIANGSRMQRELANVMIAKQQAGQLRPSFISRHLYRLFYPERVFMDSHPDKLYTRWRLRNTYEDNFDGGILQKLSTKHSKPTTTAEVTTQRSQIQEVKAELNKRSQRPEGKSELNNVIHDNPLDCILGFPGSDQEAEPNNNIVRSRKASHHHRRAHRRHRARNHKDRDQSNM